MLVVYGRYTWILFFGGSLISLDVMIVIRTVILCSISTFQAV